MHPNDAERPLLLLFRTGAQEFREYLLASIAPRYRVHIMSSKEPTWEPAYTTGWTLVRDTLDADEVVAAALELNSRDRIHGVLCWDESRIPNATRIAAALGLPGSDTGAVMRCRDKHLTRQALAAGGVPQPRSAQVDTVAEALATAEDFGYPVILKPADLALSLGVVRADTPAELSAYFEFTSGMTVPEVPDYRARVLVEEFADGLEISIDAAVHRGEVIPLVLARKTLGFAPYCIEVGHVVDAADPLLNDAELTRIVQDTHDALGFRDGVTHTELKLTATGPKIIEVNGRLGGDLIPYLGLRATGIDTGLAAAAVACGQRPEVIADRRLVAGVRFFYVKEKDTHITSLRYDETARVAATDQLSILVPPGVTTSPPPEGTRLGRIALATAVADTAVECLGALDVAEAGLRVNEPAVVPQAVAPQAVVPQAVAPQAAVGGEPLPV